MAITVPTDAYISTANALKLVPAVSVTATSVPSTTDLEEYLKICAQEINSILRGKGVTVPVTDATGVLRLAVINQYGAIGLLIMAKGPTDDLRIAADPYLRLYREGLARLQKEQFHYNVSHTDTKPRGWSELTTDGDYEDPNFTRDMQF